MQPLIDTPRSTLTAAQMVALIQDSPAMTVDGGLELVDVNLNMTEDISSFLSSGEVSRGYYNTLHGTATLGLGRELDWGAAMIRPYVTLSDSTVTARVNMGVYYTDSPKKDLGKSLPTHDVSCLDRLSILADPVGDAFSIDAGTNYLDTVETLLLTLGVAAGTYVIDQTQGDVVAPSSRAWMFEDGLTWLLIINDLLGAVGYSGIWTDWNGRLRCEPYISPRERGPEWAYTAEGSTSMLKPDRTVERNFTDAPNRWVFYRTNNVEGPSPVEGNGMYTYENISTGDTSIEARGNRIKTKPVGLDVADHASLVARAQSIIDADMAVPTKVTVGLSPNPLHWHGDRVWLNDPANGAPVDAVVTRWTFPLFGPGMSAELTVL